MWPVRSGTYFKKFTLGKRTPELGPIEVVEREVPVLWEMEICRVGIGWGDGVKGWKDTVPISLRVVVLFLKVELQRLVFIGGE